jgi:hypothetical protein
LLFETAGKDGMDKNIGNYWVFEGLGTYFETVTPQEDGSILCGGLVGPRIVQARLKFIASDDQNRAAVSAKRSKDYVPLEELVAMSRDTFLKPGDVNLHYTEAMALAVFFMQAEGGRYRDRFLDYVEAAYKGRLGRGAARTLSARLGAPYATLDGEFLKFLKDGTPPPRQSP